MMSGLILVPNIILSHAQMIPSCFNLGLAKVIHLLTGQILIADLMLIDIFGLSRREPGNTPLLLFVLVDG